MTSLSENEGLILPLPPFSLPITARVLQRRPTNKVDVWDGEAYWRLLSLPGGARLASARQRGPAQAPEIVVRVEGGPASPAVVAQACAQVGMMLSADRDTQSFHAFADADPLLGPVARSLRGLKPPRFPTLWETFLNVVVFQQISLLAALAIVGRMVERYGRRLYFDGRAFFAYPEAEAIASASIEELRALGLSLNKAVSLRALAEQVGAGEALREELSALPSLAAIDRLVQLPGIGRWSAEVVLLRGLGRLDVFPGTDSGVIRGLAEALGREGGLEKGEERRLADRFGEWRGMLYLLVAGYRIQRLGLLPST
jgi:DNA-3-methyladenine glycosylase II